jgi:hypothetical protein
MPTVESTTYLLHEPAEAYHARAGEYLTSHLLADFRRSPLLYQRRRSGLVKQDQARPAYLVGRATHTLVLEGRRRFDAEFVVGGPTNPRTGLPFGPGTKAWAEWAQAHGRNILTDEQFELISRMSEAVLTHPIASDLLREGVPESVVRTQYCETDCQIRMDWFEPHHGIADLKTCDDLTYFEADARRYGYLHQMAFYRAVLAQVIGLFVPVHIIGVEKKEPYRCGVWRVEPQALAIAQRENEAAIGRLKRCQQRSDWPTGYEELRLLDAA